MLFWYPRAEPLFKKFTLFSPLSRPLILASPVFAILKNVIALYLCAFYVLFEYLRDEPLFKKFTLISPPSHPLNLASAIFVISSNEIALHLCAFYVLFGYLRAEPLFTKFTLVSHLCHPLVLALLFFTISKNVITPHLCDLCYCQFFFIYLTVECQDGSDSGRDASGYIRWQCWWHCRSMVLIFRWYVDGSHFLGCWLSF